MERKETEAVYKAPRSEEVEEIINQPPAWLIRWGITVFFLILIVLLLASWLIRYPDFISAPFRLTAQNAPKSVTSKIDGKLQALFVKNNDEVRQGQVLGYMESIASHDEVLSLDNALQQIQKQIENDETVFRTLTFNQLGELQSNFEDFNNAYTQFLAFQTDGYFLQKRKLLQNELNELDRVKGNLLEQKVILEQNLAIAENEFKIQQDLANQKVISPLDLKREESKVLERRMPLKLLASSLFTNANLKLAKQKEMLELDKLIHEHESVFLQSLHTLKSAVDNWKKKYILSAPVSGRVYFSSFLEEKQELHTAQELFFVGADGINYYGEVNIPQHNLGKVKTGQAVMVKFDSYPFYEFGAVKGKVAFLSEITDSENNFLIKVALPHGLTTTSGRKIQYKTGMKASAEIVTEDTRLIERFFYRLKEVMAP